MSKDIIDSKNGGGSGGGISDGHDAKRDTGGGALRRELKRKGGTNAPAVKW